MIDIIKKVLYAGIGVFALSEEKTKEIISQLVKEGVLTTQEGEKLLAELKDKFVSTGKGVEDKFLEKVKDYLHISKLEEVKKGTGQLFIVN
jgi:polyhydroxyalkanoate synthesis regulator phasin